MQHLRTAKLARWQIQLLSWSGGVLWLTGVAWLLLHYFGRIKGEFGPEANPLEPWMLRFHGLAMIVSLLGVGTLLVVHVWKGWAHRHQRLVGCVLLAAVALLVLTGYLLYYVGNEEDRSWVSLVHWLLGVALPVVFIIHYRRGRRLARMSAARRAEEAAWPRDDSK
jgi:hypothetical protein